MPSGTELLEFCKDNNGYHQIINDKPIGLGNFTAGRRANLSGRTNYAFQEMEVPIFYIPSQRRKKTTELAQNKEPTYGFLAAESYAPLELLLAQDMFANFI